MMTEPNPIKKAPPRIVGLDIIRVVAIFSVIAGHFFVLNTPFREAVFNAHGIFFQGMSYLLFNCSGVSVHHDDWISECSQSRV